MFTRFEDDDEGPKTELVPALNIPVGSGEPDKPITIETDRLLVVLAQIDHGALDEGLITSAARDILVQTMIYQVVGKRFKTPTQTEYEIVNVYASHATILGVAHRVNDPTRLEIEPKLKNAIETMTRPFGNGVPETITGALLIYGEHNGFNVWTPHYQAEEFAKNAEGKLVQMHGHDYKIARAWLHGGDLTGFVMAELHLITNHS